MPVPWQIDDGNFNVLTQIGPGIPSLPFQDRGDTQSFEYRYKYRIAASAFVPLINMRISYTAPDGTIGYREQMQGRQTPRGPAYLVSQTNVTDVGGGILELDHIYASVPVSRYEGASIPYSWQLFFTDFGFDSSGVKSIGEFAMTVMGRILFEYSISQPTVTLSPRATVINDTLYSVGNFNIQSPTTEFAAADSEVGIYKGGIFYKKTPMIKLSTIKKTT